MRRLDLNLLLNTSAAELCDYKSDVHADRNAKHPLLVPFLSGYFGTEHIVTDIDKNDLEPTYVNPDLCFNIIFITDHHSGKTVAFFCGLTDTASVLEPLRDKSNTSRFGIRFNFWGVHLFTTEHLKDSYHTFEQMEYYFSGWKSYFDKMLLEYTSLDERVEQTEAFLLKHINLNRFNPNLMNI